MRTPFIIAEFGSCHEQSFTRALEGIAVAKRADADAVKYQYWSSSQRMRERRHIDDDPQAYERGSVLTTWLPLLSDEAHKRGLEFMATCYLPEDIKIVAPYVDRFKVSSFEAGDREFLGAHAGYQKDLIVSTGMQDDDFIITGEFMLHCVSAYPTPLEEAGLGVLASQGGMGYSDHTNCVYTGGFAVSAGAEILEVHFRLNDTSKECPDYIVSHPPASLAEYIRLARLAHTMRGDGVKRPQPSERANMKHRVLG